MPHLDFETERSDNERETNRVNSDQLMISSSHSDCCQR